MYSRSKLLTEVPELDQRPEYIIQTKEEKNNDNLEIEQEIECPRCHDIMTLCSEFERICFLREECNLPLYVN
jgi:hypothetical protein